ncbi:MAG: hypothetical protein AB2L24_32190 [Mangrovibacterium sp.]
MEQIEKNLRRMLIFILISGNMVTQTIAQMNFQRVVVDANGPKDPYGKTIGDIDGDGLTDLVCRRSFRRRNCMV